MANSKIIYFLLFFYVQPCCSQLLHLSQNTNFYTHQSSSGLLYISSIEGLNVYDGTKVMVYKPSTMQGMKGANIQSRCFEDDFGDLWFTSFIGLNHYISDHDSIASYPLYDNDGKEIKEDFRIYGLTNNKLFLKADSSSYIFDISSKKQLQEISINNKNNFQEKLYPRSNGYLLVATNLKKLFLYYLDQQFKLLSKKEFDIPAYCHEIWQDSILFIGCDKGDFYKLNLNTGSASLINKVSDNMVLGMDISSSGRLILSSGRQIFSFYISDNTFSTVSLKLPCDVSLEGFFNPPYIDQDDILWVSTDGSGMIKHNLNNSKFETWPIRTNENYFATSINPYGENLLINCRVGGILHLDEKGQLLDFYDQLPDGTEKFYPESGFIENEIYYFSSSNNFYSLNLVSKTIKNESLDSIYFLKQHNKYGIYGVHELNKIVKLDISNQNLTVTEAIDVEALDNEQVTGFEIIDDLFFVNINEKYTYVFESYDSLILKLLDTIKLPGKMYSILKYDQRGYLYTTSFGIYNLDSKFQTLEKFTHEKVNLNETIYGVLEDSNGYLWMSTNNGIIKYHPETNYAHRFTTKDGLSAMEFNTNGFHQMEDGRMIFSNVNGLNVFHPDSVTLSTKQAHTHFSEFELMGKPSQRFGVANYIESIELPYDENFFSFDIVGIDHAGPEGIKVKWILEGYDKTWEEEESHFVKADYKNVSPGNYTFRAVASNVDGVWTKHVKTIPVVIHPPYWRTWWFSTLAILSLGSLAFFSIRFYYRQKIKEKDFQIRENELLLSRQKALEEERTRIAGEMHDDIGGGLTSIRFLSKKLLRKIHDGDTKAQVEKVVTHSEQLVKNMSEIIWAMNSEFDTLENFVAYLRRFSFEFLENYQIQLTFNVEGEIEDVNLSGKYRRNLFLIAKEVLHNIVKHSKATKTLIHINHQNSELQILIKDNGIGIQQENEFGNGLKNMETRIKKIGGNIQFKNHEGCEVQINLFNIMA